MSDELWESFAKLSNAINPEGTAVGLLGLISVN